MAGQKGELGRQKNIWIAKQKGNGQVKNIYFELPKQVEILLNGTPNFFPISCPDYKSTQN